MSYFIDFIKFFLHIDKNILSVVNSYGLWTYLIMFAVIFCETGLVITPFLPGDSLVFVLGAVLSKTSLHTWAVFWILCIAAILGDTVNYQIGYHIGPKLFEKEHIRFIKKEYLERTQNFYERHGRKTIIMARFIPIIRTFAPFVAGIGKMSYKTFITYNMIGGISWISLLLFTGLFFGDIPFVSHNFTMIIYAIVVISVIPAIFEIVRQRYFSHNTGKDIE